MGRQPDARVFMSDTTTDVENVLLHNSVNVMKRQREELGITMYPLTRIVVSTESPMSGNHAD